MSDLMREALGEFSLPQANSNSSKVLTLDRRDLAGEEQLLERLRRLRLKDVALALEDQLGEPSLRSCRFVERLDQLLELEESQRARRSLRARLSRAQLRLPARLADLDYTHARGLDPELMASLAQGAWIKAGHNLLITGGVGVGKTFVACALGHQACRQGHRALYRRFYQLIISLAQARRQDRFSRALAALAKPDLLIVDDWAQDHLDREQSQDLLEVIDARHGRKSTLVVSRLGAPAWQGRLGDALFTRALADRILPGALHLELAGPSLRSHYVGQENESA